MKETHHHRSNTSVNFAAEFHENPLKTFTMKFGEEENLHPYKIRKRPIPFHNPFKCIKDTWDERYHRIILT